MVNHPAGRKPQHFRLGQNEIDGSVSILASGESENLAQFIQKIKNSPTPFAKVKSLQVNYIAKRVNKGFNVKY